jgi:hypothetical protein
VLLQKPGACVPVPDSLSCCLPEQVSETSSVAPRRAAVTWYNSRFRVDPRRSGTTRVAGSLLYFCLTSRRPFRGYTVAVPRCYSLAIASSSSPRRDLNLHMQPVLIPAAIRSPSRPSFNVFCWVSNPNPLFDFAQWSHWKLTSKNPCRLAGPAGAPVLARVPSQLLRAHSLTGNSPELYKLHHLCD